MALDITQLRERLDEHRRALSLQREQIAQQLVAVDSSFRGLFAVYGGVTAEELAARWCETVAWFESYVESMRAFERLLERRIEEARAV